MCTIFYCILNKHSMVTLYFKESIHHVSVMVSISYSFYVEEMIQEDFHII